MAEYSGVTVYVTGAGSGMGLASARRLAAAGADVVGFVHGDVARAPTVIEQSRLSAEQRVRFYSADVSDRLATRDAIHAAVAECGPPDIVIHMAGIGGVAEFADMPYTVFDRMIQTNLYGTRHVVEAVLPHLRARSGRRPALVLVGSLGGIVPIYGYTAYGTSKFGVVGFASCLRYELAPRGIDVVCFCPGEVATEGLAAEREAPHAATTAMKNVGGTISIERAIDGLLAGLRRRRFLVIPGVRSRLVYLAQSLTPITLWHAITDRIVARALRTTPARRPH